MLRTVGWIFALVCCVLLIIPAHSAAPLAPPPAPSHQQLVASELATALPPLPETCGGGLPDGACCLNGYVIVDGQAVEGAKVTIASAHGRFERWTDYAFADDEQTKPPFYTLALSDTNVRVGIGETITITAEYSGHTQTITHTTLPGGQRVDVVLPRNGNDDYVFDGQIWYQAEVRKFAYPFDITVDPASGILYISDTNNARVQGFGSFGNLLPKRTWGIFGNQPGEFSLPTGIALDSRDGAVYVADTGNFRVQKFTNIGQSVNKDAHPAPTTMWSYTNGPRGKFAPAGVAVDSAGDVYVTDPPNDRILKFDSTGILKEEWVGRGTTEGLFNFPADIAIAADDTVYVVDQKNHRVQWLLPDGTWHAWGSQGSALGQFQFPTGVAVGPDGSVYVSDSGNNRIQKRRPNGEIIAWDGQGTVNGQLREPKGLAIFNDNVYVVDTENHRIRVFTIDGTQQLTSWGGKDDTEGQFVSPIGVAAQGNRLYTSEWDNPIVKMFEPSADDPNQLEYVQKIGEGVLSRPLGIAADAQGNLFVVDFDAQTVKKFDQNGIPQSWQLDTPLICPTGIAVDGQGFVYVVDTLLGTVFKFYPDGELLKSWGQLVSPISLPCPLTSLPASRVLPTIAPHIPIDLGAPLGIAVTPDGQLIYVADTLGRRIVRFDDMGMNIISWGTEGSQPGQFNVPTTLALDHDGDLYVADSGILFETIDNQNHRVQKFTGDGVFLNIIGGPGGGDGDFVTPIGVAIDDANRLYVADSRNNRVQRLRTMTFSAPIATIVKISRSPVLSTTLELYGQASVSDSNSTIAGYEWWWEHDTITQTFAATPQALLDTSALEPGDYTLHFQAHDSQGQFSEVQTSTIALGAATDESKWMMLLYLDADTQGVDVVGDLSKLLGPDEGALFRLKQLASQGGLPPNVTVAALYDGPEYGDSAYYLFMPDQPGGEIILPMAEVNMGNPRTLIDFVRWAKAQQTLPAEHYYLSIADHGNGIAGSAWDYTTSPDGSERLTVKELYQALWELSNLGRERLDIVHLDSCLMAMIENAYQIHDAVDYLIASENLAWGAFAYERYAREIGALTDARTFASRIVDEYAQQVVGYPYTISALDLGTRPNGAAPLIEVGRKTDDLAQALIEYLQAHPEERGHLLQLRAETQKFDSNGNISLTNDDAYVDLLDWTRVLSDSFAEGSIHTTSLALHDVLPSLVVRNNTASGEYGGVPVGLDNASGVSIYFPDRPNNVEYQTYNAKQFRFLEATHWAEFLAALLDTQAVDTNAPPLEPIPPWALQNRRNFLPIVQR